MTFQLITEFRINLLIAIHDDTLVVLSIFF